jgi:prepilin-type N-terminal cleavage/methylation domain-containing protein/prepilin-type processing-associated H-X9-DG protein
MSPKRQNPFLPLVRAFTLIELLVVISIIAMLMSILLPSLTRAREAGKRVACLSNMRQLTFAWYFYANDHDDKLCSPDTYWNDQSEHQYWVGDGLPVPSNNVGGSEIAIRNGVLWPYAEQTLDLYKCTSDATGPLRSYSISNTMGGRIRDGVTPFRSIAEITQAPSRCAFIDAGTRWPWIVDSFWPVNYDNDRWQWQIHAGHNITARHAGGCNMSFADFHCEYVRWRDFRTEKLAFWEIQADKASDNNPDLSRIAELLEGR